MTEDPQRVAIDFLAASSTHGGAPVERIETHASLVFLARDRAWKMKRAVKYDYLDFSTRDRRRDMCDAEVRLNRRTAPEIYRGVVAVTREPDGTLALGGRGDPLEWVIEMARFDQGALFDRLAGRGALDPELMPPLAEAIARLHEAADRRYDHGGHSGMAWVIDGNAAGFAQHGGRFLPPDACARVTALSHLALQRVAEQLDRRRQSGFVRQCHGDLHLRNIVLLEGRPTLFDAVEFNDEIACIDVIYDLAFLVMDLWRRELHAHANRVLNAYLSETADFSAVSLLPLFLACRAGVRAKTTATAAVLQADPQRGGQSRELAQRYLALAGDLLEPAPPCLIAVGGLSGSGKSTLARALAPSVGAVPGALVIRSDELRKRLRGVAPLTRLGPDAYTDIVSAQVYSAAFKRAGEIVRAGHAAIVDAVFLRPQDREAAEQAAAAAGVPFFGLWLDAPEPVLIERSERRRADPSDADAGVIRGQAARDTGPITWHRLDASAPISVLQQEALHMIGLGMGK